jgi:hypothetical protein
MTTARTIHCPQHVRHVGTCPACQRARLQAEKQQLAEVDAIRAGAALDLRGAAVPQPAPASGGVR